MKAVPLAPLLSCLLLMSLLSSCSPPSLACLFLSLLLSPLPLSALGLLTLCFPGLPWPHAPPVPRLSAGGHGLGEAP